MDPVEPDPRHRDRRLDHAGRVGERHAELRRIVTGGDRLMRRHLHFGHHAEQDRLHAALRAGDRIEPFEFGPVVDDDERDTRTHRERQFLVGLVVAVQHDAGGGRSRPQARLHLAAGRGQEVEAFVQHDPQHGVGGERLHGIEHAGEPPGDRAGTIADLLLVHHEQRRAEPGGQLGEGEAADLEPPRPTQGGGGPRRRRQFLGCRWTRRRLSHRRCAPSTPAPRRRGCRGGSR